MLFSFGDVPSAGVVAAAAFLASSAFFQSASAGNAFGCLSGKNGPNTYQYGTDVPTACNITVGGPVPQPASQPQAETQPSPARQRRPKRPIYEFSMDNYGLVVLFDPPKVYSDPPPTLASPIDAHDLVYQGRRDINTEKGNRLGSATRSSQQMDIWKWDGNRRGQRRDLILDGAGGHDITFDDCNAVIDAFERFIDKYEDRAAKAGKPKGIPPVDFVLKHNRQIVGRGEFRVENSEK